MGSEEDFRIKNMKAEDFERRGREAEITVEVTRALHKGAPGSCSGRIRPIRGWYRGFRFMTSWRTWSQRG